jgi:hypothetical protein
MNACLLNEVMSCKASKKTNIVPGMGATRFVGSDRYAMVVTYVMSPKRIRVAHLFNEDEDKFVENEDGMQVLPEDLLEKYYTQDKYDENGFALSYHCSSEYTLRKNGRWMPKGDGCWGTGAIHIGHAENYRDPSF